MSRKFSGMQFRLKQLQPVEAHKLNLAIVKAYSLSSIRNMMGTVHK